MTSDKMTYWQRRKEGRRGQEELPEPRLIKESGVMLGFTKDGKPIAKNRRQRRQKIVDRTFTKKGYRAILKNDDWVTIKTEAR